MSRAQRPKPRPGPLSWVFLCYAFFGIAGVVSMVRAGVRAADGPALICLLVALGLWRRRVWARWLGVAVSAWVVLNTAVVLAAGGRISGAAFGALLAHAWLACMLVWRWSER